LFSNAGDLAVLMQMLLQNGTYGGDRYFDPNTVKKFLTRHPQSNRRALGFDMLPIGSKYPPNVSSRVSERTFGHIGFTGVCAWADPEEELVFIFLANRTFPSMRNYRLNKLAIRNRMQNAVYDALFNRPEPFYLTRLEQPVFTID
jgi:beta-N-acetylhexosaminidase